MERHPKEKSRWSGARWADFYATWLAEEHSVRAVLINPAIDPHVSLRAYVGPQRAFHGGRARAHRRAPAAMEGSLSEESAPRALPAPRGNRDEVLDYRAAVRKYRGAKLVVVQGGDHTLRAFPNKSR